MDSLLSPLTLSSRDNSTPPNLPVDIANIFSTSTSTISISTPTTSTIQPLALQTGSQSLQWCLTATDLRCIIDGSSGSCMPYEAETATPATTATLSSGKKAAMMIGILYSADKWRQSLPKRNLFGPETPPPHESSKSVNGSDSEPHEHEDEEAPPNKKTKTSKGTTATAAPLADDDLNLRSKLEIVKKCCEVLHSMLKDEFKGKVRDDSKEEVNDERVRWTEVVGTKSHSCDYLSSGKKVVLKDILSWSNIGRDVDDVLVKLIQDAITNSRTRDKGKKLSSKSRAFLNEMEFNVLKSLY